MSIRKKLNSAKPICTENVGELLPTVCSRLKVSFSPMGPYKEWFNP